MVGCECVIVRSLVADSKLIASLCLIVSNIFDETLGDVKPGGLVIFFEHADERLKKKWSIFRPIIEIV